MGQRLADDTAHDTDNDADNDNRSQDGQHHGNDGTESTERIGSHSGKTVNKSSDQSFQNVSFLTSEQQGAINDVCHEPRP